jgi:hypothetical protein
MNKFKKRITKNIRKTPIDALVLGNAFGRLDAVLDVFDTVFLYGNDDLTLRFRNLIYRTELNSTFNLYNLTAIFIDLKHIGLFETLVPLLNNPQPDLFIEGNEVIPKTETKILYREGYRAVAQLGDFHQWSKIV